jgi:hypothetical protein
MHLPFEVFITRVIDVAKAESKQSVGNQHIGKKIFLTCEAVITNVITMISEFECFITRVINAAKAEGQAKRGR